LSGRCPYIPKKRINKGWEHGCETFEFIFYDSYEVEQWLYATLGKVNYNLTGSSYIKVYLQDPEQIAVLKLAWM